MSILQELLNLGLVNIGDDDSRFGKLVTAATAMEARFKEDPSLLVPATLIAIDSDVEENDPIFSLVEELVIAEWKTLRNTHTNRPRELLRSIIIEAISNAAHENPDVAGVVWHTAVSPIKHGQARLGKEIELISELVNRSGTVAEQAAIARAGMVQPERKDSKRKKTSKDEPSLKLEAAITDEEVLTDVARSVGPTDAQGQPLTEPNPQWPNSHQPWSHAFTPLMTNAIVKAVNLGMRRLCSATIILPY